MNRKRQNELAILQRRMAPVRGPHVKPPPAPEPGVCPHCKAELGEAGIRGHECPGLTAAVQEASSPAFDRLVLDVELLEYRKRGHKACQGEGWYKRYLIPAGAQLRSPSEARQGIIAIPSGKDCGLCKGAKTVPMTGSAPDAVQKCPACDGEGKELPRCSLSICECAARRFARENRGRFAPVGERFMWLKGKAPPIPKDWRSPLEAARPPVVHARLVDESAQASAPEYRRAVGFAQQLTDAPELAEQIIEARNGQ